MEEDSQEWWKTNRKVRINRSSRVWKRVSESDATSDDVGTNEDEKITRTNEDINNYGNISVKDTAQETSDNESEDSKVALNDTQSLDVTLERDDDGSLIKEKGDEEADDNDDQRISVCEDNMLQNQDKEDLNVRIKRNYQNNNSDGLTTNLDDEETSTTEDYLMKRKEDIIGEVKTAVISKVGDDRSNDKEESISENEQNEDKSERNSVIEEINEDGDKVSDQVESEDCSYDDDEQNCDIHEACRLANPQSGDINLDLVCSENEQSIRNNDTVFKSLSVQEEELDYENKDSTDDDGNENERNNQMPIISRSVSEPNYGYLFNDPIECLNSLLEEKQKRNTIVTDSQRSRLSDNYSEKEKEGEETLNSEQIGEEIPGSGNEQINTRALSKNATTYQLEKFEKNALIIFNQESINGYKPRLGTREDAEALTNTFGNYGFEIEEHVDLVRDDIFRALKKFSERDFTDYGCVAVAILTHGSDMGVLKAKDRSFYEMDVINFFKTQGRPTLVTKPKIIIIQACRGSKTTQAVHVMKFGKISTDHEDSQLQHYTLPVEADTLVLHSTYVGNISHRDETHGSWLIQTLCRKINELAGTQDLEAIITEVKREVAIDKVHEDYNRRTHETDFNKQMPVVTSTLIRKLYLRKFEGDDVKETNETSEFDNANVAEDSALENIYNSPVSQSATEDVPTFAPCICFLDRFEYLRDCMRYFVQDNPDDETAQSFLDVAEVLHEGPEFNGAKEKVSRAIRNHLQNKAKEFDYFKYLYLYKD